jgi:hypothetical protein
MKISGGNRDDPHTDIRTLRPYRLDHRFLSALQDHRILCQEPGRGPDIPDGGVMTQFTEIRLSTNEYASRTVDQIELHGYDLCLRTDITSERQIRLAERMAADLGIALLDRRAS